jgi:steroid delta-isomerase-like uncharacterized protein
MAQENSALIRRWFEEVWNKGRTEAIDEMSAPDVIGHGQAQHDTDIGLAEFKIFAADLHSAFPDIKVVIDQTIEQGDKVVARWTSTMTHTGEFLGFPATGKKATITGTSIQRILNGKIVEGWDNWDQLGLLVQIGAVPSAHFVKPADRRIA